MNKQAHWHVTSYCEMINIIITLRGKNDTPIRGLFLVRKPFKNPNVETACLHTCS